MMDKRFQGSKKKARKAAFLNREDDRKIDKIRKMELNQAISNGDFDKALKLMRSEK
ncbi:MAG: hypothetical protein A4E66_00681 [Syntrophus sp. PtaB.Bin001]|nr:MAG: hypothetical protein A4E66_00681 [Syntrophus sp. PtaB.Bin001]